MNQIEKLKARLATATPAEAAIIKELIQTLETATDAPEAQPEVTLETEQPCFPPGQRDN